MTPEQVMTAFAQGAILQHDIYDQLVYVVYPNNDTFPVDWWVFYGMYSAKMIKQVNPETALIEIYAPAESND